MERRKRTNSWDEPRSNVARAKRFLEGYGVHDAHPNDFMAPPADKDDWERLLNNIK